MSFVSQFLRLVHITMSILMGSVIGFLILHIGFRDERWKWKRIDMDKKGEQLFILMGILLFIFVPMLTMIIMMVIMVMVMVMVTMMVMMLVRLHRIVDTYRSRDEDSKMRNARI